MLYAPNFGLDKLFDDKNWLDYLDLHILFDNCPSDNEDWTDNVDTFDLDILYGDD